VKTRELVTAALLAALSLAIPLAFGGFLMVQVPPWTATIASHVPLFLSMLVSPLAALMVGAVSALGFFIKVGPVVGARAAMHILVGGVGANLVRREVPFRNALLIVLPIHAVSEALIVLPFGWSLANAGVVVAVGTALHHLVDTAIALSLAGILAKINLAFWRH
jgi:niacin transporter